MIKNFTTTQRVMRATKASLFSFALFVSLTAVTPNVEAQVYNENFSVLGPYPQTVLPRGWTQGKYGTSTSAINQWDLMNNTATNPVAVPPSLPSMMRFASWSIPANESSFLSSKRLDMRNMPGAGAVFSFQFFRDNNATYAGTMDRIQVFVNDSAVVSPGNPSQTLLADNTFGATTIHRSSTQAPVQAAGWQTYSFTIPQVAGANTYNTANVYIHIVATSMFGNNMYIDNFTVTQYGNDQAYIGPAASVSAAGAAIGATTITVAAGSLFAPGQVFSAPAGIAGKTITSIAGNVITFSPALAVAVAAGATVSTATPVSATVITQNTNTTAPNQNDQQIIGLRIDMDGINNPRQLSGMLFNTNGSSNPPTDISRAKLWTTGGTELFNPANALLIGEYINPHLTNYGFLTAPNANYIGPANFTGLEHGINYLWITYNLPPGAVSGNYVDAEWIGMTMNGYAATATAPVQQTLAGARLIDVVYCQPVYYTGTAWAGYDFNDFVNGVQLTGDNIPAGGLGTIPTPANQGNFRNTINQFAGPQCPPPYPRFCPFQSHPPDYENFPEASSIGNTTTQLTAYTTLVGNPALSGYPMQLQVGEYGSGNAIAAWIDYNGDGIFNNYFDNIKKLASTTSGSPTINILGGVYTTSLRWSYGLNAGMTVYGPGIPAGTTILTVAGNVITLSANATASSAGTTIEFVNETAPNNRGEKIAQSGPLSGYGIISAEFKVPSWATNFAGKRRMRVREVWINYNIDPCNAATYGETEDYTVTIRPDCPVYPGYTTWLGFSTDWTDPSNWCPSIVPIQGNPLANIRFPGGPTGGSYTYIKPVIASGVQARAIKMRVEVGDTVFIDAPAASDLVVTDSLIIQTPTSAIKINTTNVDTAQVYNGLIYPPTPQNGENLIPLRTTTKMRTQLIYDRQELINLGMIDGDVIDTLRLHFTRRSPGAVYRNLKVKYFYTGPLNSFVSATTVLPFSGLPNPATQVYSGTVDISPTAINAGGTAVLPLSVPIIVTPVTSNRRLVLDISYDQTGFPLSGTTIPENEDMRFTQTGNQNWYMTWSSNSQHASVPAAENMVQNMPNVNSTFAAAGVINTNTITVTNASTLFAVGMVMVTPTAIRDRVITSIVGNVITLSSNYTSVTGMTSGASVSAQHYDYKSNWNHRANVTFSIRRPYIKYPISVAGHWLNNGDFIPAVSSVTLNGTTTQRILGTSTTTYYDLTLSNNAHAEMNADVNVQQVLTLTAGRLKLNNRLLTLQRNDIGAIVRTNGFIQADNDLIANNISPYGRVRWMMGTDPALRDLPFINFAGTYLPLTYKPQGGSHDVLFSTYRTNPDNTNIPAPTVTNIYGFNGTSWNSDGTALADRFYRVENTTPTGAVADFTFRYEASNTAPYGERSSANPLGASVMKAQRWLNDSTKWEQFPFFHPTQTYGLAAGHDFVNIEGFNMGSGVTGSWWVITGQATPLPVTLLDFVAEPFKDRVKLKWSTSAEINASHYIVERTLDNESFSFIGQVPANGTTTSRTDYSTWDLNPAQGIQYYYLRQYDRDGRMESYGPVSAKFTTEMFDIVTATISSTEMGMTIVFNYDSTEPVAYKIIDVAGRIVAQKDRNPAEPGLNVIDINTKLAKGVYQIILQNSEKQVSRKFFY